MSPTPRVDFTLDEVLARLPNPKRAGSTRRAPCPAYRDSTAVEIANAEAMAVRP